MSVETKTRPKAKRLPRFVPVIFANGDDDDAPGLQACADNEAVQFDGRIYEPNEEVTIVGRHLVLGSPVHGNMEGPVRIVVKGCFLDTSRYRHAS